MVYRKSRAFLTHAVLLGVAMTSVQAYAKSVTVKGEYAIENKDEAAARKAALKDAFRKAVEQVAGVKVKSTTISSEWEIVKDEIIAKTEGMVTSHKVLSEGAKAGVYEITIQAEVADKPVSDAIDQLISLKNNSKIAVLLAERMAGNTDYNVGTSERGMTENIMINMFQERGFPVVDLSGLAGIDLSSGARQGNLSADDAAKVADAADAQYVVIGKVEGKDAGKIMGSDMRSYQMVVSMRIFAVSNHSIIATATQSGGIPSVSGNFPPSAMKLYKSRVLEPVVVKLVERIAKVWTQEEQTGSRRVQVVVQNVPNYKALKSITAEIKKIKGVSSATQRALKNKNAKIDVEVESDTDALAEALSDAKIAGFKVEVVGVDEGKIVINVKR